jgi:hypothetical protein
MATGTAAGTTTAAPDSSRKTVQTIERQLRRARFHVKLVDLLSHVGLLAVGVLGYLLLVALIDHWIWPLGFAGRTIAFVGLVAGSAWLAARYLAPLVIRRINPTYAARAIEEARPSLKNSLINFLLLRQDRTGVRDAIFEAVEQRAASDIATVQVESAVDRTPMIRIGYVLVAVAALFAAYKILSPKDPFRTAARVVMPWAEIARPSRVEIVEVKPGSMRVYHGHTVQVTATVNGAGDTDPVRLYYTTADGQSVDREIRMQAKPGRLHFECLLPPQEDASPAAKPGLQQDVTYRIEAGDAVSPDYRLSVVAAPTIVVQKLEYQYPAYTKKPPQTIERQGDIQAIEGTKVTIHAQANQPIQSAMIELDPDQSPRGAAETVPLQFDGQHAWGTITLKLKPDRLSPWHASYQVRFVNLDGEKSEQPIRHQIDVLRDLPPEVQILSPTQRRVEVPENGSQTIEARGIDPDFGLSRLALHFEGAGKDFDEELLITGSEQLPQATAKFLFRPQAYGFKAGDEVQYWAIAADNRENPATGSAEPNEVTTNPCLIIVVAPQEKDPGEKSEQPPQEAMPPPESRDDRRSPAGDKPPMTDKPESPQEKQPPEGQKSDEPKEGQKSEQPMDSSQEGSKTSQPGQQGKSSKGDQGKSASKSPSGGAGQKSQEPSGDPQSAEGKSGQGSQGSSQSRTKSGESTEENPQQESPADGASGQSSPGGARGTGQNAREPAGSQQGRTDESGDPTGRSESPAKPAHDGDAIEEILRHRQEKEGQPGSKPVGQRNAAAGEKPAEGQTESPSSREGQSQPGTDPQRGKTEGAQGQKGKPKEPDQTGDAQGEGAKSDQARSDGKSGQKSERGAGEKGQGEGAPAGAGQKSDERGASGTRPGQGDAAGADTKFGEGPQKNDTASSKGGQPRGPMNTKKGDEPSGAGAKGEKKEPGMGKTGQSGAGTAGKDKTGSGESQGQGKDREKELGPDGDKPEQSDTSPPAGSKRQSDSKGGQSGDKAGGGKQGAGQPANQAGNDTAGTQSPGDEGAGAAAEQGQGPTGDRAGSQQKAEGKTGASDSEKGQGTGSKSGLGTNAGGDAPPEGSPQDRKDGTQQSGNGRAGPPLGGGDPNRPDVEYGPKGEVPDGEEANLEFAKKQTDLALQYLRDQKDDPDPELLDRLGWTKEEMQEFLRRWEALQEAAAKDPNASRELDESLKSLGLAPAKNRKRAGGMASDSTRDLRDSGSRTSAPKSYREQFDNFRKGSR